MPTSKSPFCHRLWDVAMQFVLGARIIHVRRFLHGFIHRRHPCSRLQGAPPSRDTKLDFEQQNGSKLVSSSLSGLTGCCPKLEKWSGSRDLQQQFLADRLGFLRAVKTGMELPSPACGLDCSFPQSTHEIVPRRPCRDIGYLFGVDAFNIVFKQRSKEYGLRVTVQKFPRTFMFQHIE